MPSTLPYSLFITPISWKLVIDKFILFFNSSKLEQDAEISRYNSMKKFEKKIYREHYLQLRQEMIDIAAATTPSAPPPLATAAAAVTSPAAAATVVATPAAARYIPRTVTPQQNDTLEERQMNRGFFLQMKEIQKKKKLPQVLHRSPAQTAGENKKG